MAQFWLPGDSDFALAMREPNLLLPNRKPLCEVRLKSLGIESFWGIGGPGGKTDGSSYGTAPTRLSDRLGRNNLHGYQFNGSNEPNIIATPYGPGIERDNAALSYGSMWIGSGPNFLYNQSGTYFVAAWVKNPSEKVMLIGSANHGQTPLRNYGDGIYIETDGYIYGWRSSNSASQYARLTLPDSDLIVAAFSASATTGVLSVNGRSSTGTISSTGYPGYNFSIGECAHSENNNIDRFMVDGAILGAAYSKMALTEYELNVVTRDFFRYFLEPVNQVPVYIGLPAGGGTPTLSSPSVSNVQSDRATPQVTLTF